MTDLFADIDLVVADGNGPERKCLLMDGRTRARKERKEKWYQRHSPGWAPEPDDVTLAPRPLAACNANQCPSLVYAPTVEVEAELAGAKLYYPMIGVLWEYRGTFLAHGGEQYYEVEVLNTIPGCGIRIGSVWSAQAEKFRRIQ